MLPIARPGADLQRLDQPLQRRVHHPAHPLRVRRGRHLRRQRELLPPVVHRERHGVVRPLLCANAPHALPRLPRLLRTPRPAAVAIVQQRGEQRRGCRHAAAALRQRQRGVLVPQQVRQQRVRAPHRRLDPLLAHPDPHRQRVDERAHHPVRPLAALHAAEEQRPEDHVLPAAQPRQHLRPRQVAQARRAHPQRPRPPAQPRAQVARHRKPRLPDPVSLPPHVQQPVRRRRLLHVPQHPAEEPLVLLPAHPQARLRHVVAERQRRRQLRLAAQQVRRDLLPQHLQRLVVARQVVREHQQQPPATRAVLGDARPQQRRPPQVHPVLPGVVAPPQLLGRIPCLRIQLHLLHRQRRVPPDDLHRLAQPLPGHGRAQDVVAVDHRLQCRQVLIQARAGVELGHARQQVRVALLRQQVVEEDPLLQRGQRVDVLHVRGSARHPRHDPVDLRLAQLHQRQHLRRDGLAPLRDPVRGDLHLRRRSAHGQGQLGQHRRGEQGPHVRVQPRAPHPPDQPDRQERVPAQLEEVVPPPHPLHAQHLCPDLRPAPPPPPPAVPRSSAARTHPPPAPAAPCGPACRSRSAAARPARRTPPAPCTPAGSGAGGRAAPRPPLRPPRTPPAAGRPARPRARRRCSPRRRAPGAARPRSRPARCGSRGSSPARPGGPGTPASRPPSTAPGRRVR